MIKRCDLYKFDLETVLEVQNLIIYSNRFKRARVRNELSHAGFNFKEYQNWWGSDFKILGEYPVGRLQRLFDWLDGSTDIIRSGMGPLPQPTTIIVQPRF